MNAANTAEKTEKPPAALAGCKKYLGINNCNTLEILSEKLLNKPTTELTGHSI